MKVEVEGEGHTFGNLMQETLLEDKTVDWAGYDQPHPLFRQSIITVRVKGEAQPEKALERASKKIRADTDEFVEQAMTPGPSTVRPSIGADALLERMRERNLASLLVTTPDGRLVGLVRREDLE